MTMFLCIQHHHHNHTNFKLRKTFFNIFWFLCWKIFFVFYFIELNVDKIFTGVVSLITNKWPNLVRPTEIMRNVAFICSNFYMNVALLRHWQGDFLKSFVICYCNFWTCKQYVNVFVCTTWKYVGSSFRNSNWLIPPYWPTM